MKDKDLLGTALAIGAAVGLAYGAKKAIDSIGDLEKQADHDIFDELIRKQEVYDKVDGGMLMSWFGEKRAHYPEKTMGVLARVTQENAEMFLFGTVPDAFDSEHALYQAVIEADSGVTLESRLISFCNLSSTVSQGLEGKSYIFFQ